LNSPIQGTGADLIKAAVALLWERRGQVPGAVPVLAVHDELVVEVDAVQADAVAAWLRRAMVDAAAPILDPVPVGAVNPVVCRTWAGNAPGTVPPIPAVVRARDAVKRPLKCWKSY
jgi:DNA polymerase-1